MRAADLGPCTRGWALPQPAGGPPGPSLLVLWSGACLGGQGTQPGRLLPYLQGTPVVPLLNSVLLDKTQWETPRQFNPGHFLDAHGHFVEPEAFLPFSAGARPRGQRPGVSLPHPQVAWGLTPPTPRWPGHQAPQARSLLPPPLCLPRADLGPRHCRPGSQAALPWPPWAAPTLALDFPTGRRVCVGESLARSELFLLFAGLLQSFRLLPPPGLCPEDLDTVPAPAFTMRPPAQALCAVPRPQGR